MKKLFLDIETLPAEIEKPEVLEKMQYLHERSVGKVSKKEARLNDKVGQEAQSFEEFILQTSFDGGFGRILCIAFAVDDDEVRCYSSDENNKWNEKKVLENFWKIAGQCDSFVGHNIFDFDMRFIWQRSVVLGVKPTWQEEEPRSSKYLSFAKYRSFPMFDTKQEWMKWSFGGKSGLEYIALALGIPSPKDGIDGSQVAEFYKKGEVKKICDYCKRDVETTRAVYKRMTFQ